jgi:hypothetical protein
VLLGNGDGTFRPLVTYPVGRGPNSIVVGDFADDGHLDLAVANGVDNTVSVLAGNGDGTFQPLSREANAVGAAPISIAVGKFNNNGRTDLAVVNSGANNVSVLLGNGDGTFQPQVTYPVGTDPGSIVASDFNGDGRTDLAVANRSDNTVSVLLGNGDGTFQPQVTYPVGATPFSIVAGNFAGDGRTDLAVANSGDGTVSVLLGNGDGTFQPRVTYPVGRFPSSIVAGDFTGDGRTDLAVTNRSDNTVSVLLGNGDGTFRPQVTYPVGQSPNSIVAGDFRGDGRTDLAVTYLGANAVSVLLGNGDGTFRPQVNYPVGQSPNSIVAGDFRGDGRTDLAVASYSDDTLSVLVSNGDGTFQPQVTYPVGQLPNSIVAGDFNGDGRTDLAVTNFDDNTVSVLVANGEGSFAVPGQFATAPRATPLVADVNGDGTDDVLVVDGTGTILYRQGIPGQPGTFEPPITVNPGFPSRDIAWLPKTDQGPVLASVDARDDAISFYAYRDGQFVRLSSSLATGLLPAQILAAPLVGDGLDDLIVRNAGDGTLSVYRATFAAVGPVSALEPPSFLPAERIPVGPGVSDVEAVDTRDGGALDLVVTNQLTGQVHILPNLGDGFFAAPIPYRGGAGLTAIDPGSTPEVTSLEATAGLAAGAFTTGGLTDLVTINPGSTSLDVLAGLGAGRFANPIPLTTAAPARAVRVADFDHDGIPDLAVLTAQGLSIYLGDGKGGFLPPVTYDAGPDPSGLTVADVNQDGNLDLLIGNSYGDVLVLLGQGNGSFHPYRKTDQSIELAVADLTGNGSKDIIYADQGLDRVVVDYGAGKPSIVADQSSGLLAPGAVALADLNGDGIPDLVVANSGSNNVLIYPGLGNGQFAPAVNGGHGYFVGTNPVGITVANLIPGNPLPDLVVADKGSNQVSILLNRGDFRFTAGPRLNSGGTGPVSVLAGHFTGGVYPDLLVTNSGSNDVMLMPGVGQGFFNDQNPRTFAVGTDPVASFVGNFDGKPDLVTINAGSNDLTLVSSFGGAEPVTSTLGSGGVDPTTAFAFAGGSGFEDLVVGNSGDGVLALFEGGPSGLGLMSAETEPNLPEPTALALAALSGGQVQFYAATAGREAAELVALSLGIQTEANAPLAAPPAVETVVQLVPLHEASLPLVATVLTLTISVSNEEPALGPAEAEGTGVAAFLPGAGIALGQGPAGQSRSGGSTADEPAKADEAGANLAPTAPAAISVWERTVLGLDEALERYRRENPGGLSGAGSGSARPAGDRPESPASPSAPAQGVPASQRSAPDRLPSGGAGDGHVEPSPMARAEVIDAAIGSLWGEGARPDRPVRAPAATAIERVPIGSAGAAPCRGSLEAARFLIISEPGQDEPGLGSASLLVALLAAEWGSRRRSGTSRRGLSQGGNTERTGIRASKSGRRR